MRVLAIGDVDEESADLAGLSEVVDNAGADAVVFTGNLLKAEARRAELEAACGEDRCPDWEADAVTEERENDAESANRFFQALGDLDVPVYLVPGENDAPERFILQVGLNSEVVGANVNLVHRSFAPLGQNLVVSGVGGRITTNERLTCFLLRYPGWEAQFSLDFLRHFEQEKILLFHTPIDIEEEAGGHEAVRHIIKTYSPKIAVCGRRDGKHGKDTVGRTLVVYPGMLKTGDYAFIDTREKTVEFGDIR